MEGLINFIRVSPTAVWLTYILTLCTNAVGRLLRFVFRRDKKPSGSDSAGAYVPSAPINGQGIGPVSEYPFGKYKMCYNGCAVIAAYNALCILDSPADIGETADYFERRGIILGGAFGVHPLALNRFLCCRGHSVKTVFAGHRKNQDRLDRALNDAGAAVFTFWNSTAPRHKGEWEGAHTVAVKRENGGVTVYNAHNNSSSPAKYRSLDAYIKKEGILPIVLSVLE